MLIKSKKDLEKLWEIVAPSVKLPNSVKLTDIEYSIGWNRTTYISLELNEKLVFFIFDTDGPYIQVFSHEQIDIEAAKVAIVVKNLFTSLVYSKQHKQAKVSKSD